MAIIMAVAIIFPPSIALAKDNNNSNEPQVELRAGPTIYKKNVRVSYEYGNYRRVSNDVVVRSGQKASISANRSETFKTEVSGSIAGLGISTSDSQKSELGYTLSTSTAGTWYLAFRPRYKVERGTRVYVHGMDGSVSENSYVVKTPIAGGQYALLRR